MWSRCPPCLATTAKEGEASRSVVVNATPMRDRNGNSLGAVETEDYDEKGVAHLTVRLPRADWNRLMKKGPDPLF